MGNQHMNASAQTQTKAKASYFSVDYLHGSACTSSSGVESLQQFDSVSSNSRESPRPLVSPKLAQKITYRTLHKSTIQRNKSYVRPENKVLPREIPTKALRQTNLFANEGFNKTWRNKQKNQTQQNKHQIHFNTIEDDNDSVISSSSDYERQQKSLENLKNLRITNEIKNYREKYSRSMDNLEEWTQPMQPEVTSKIQRKNSMHTKQHKRNMEDISFMGKVKFESNACLVEQSLAESLDLNNIKDKSFKLKSKSFTSERKQLKKKTDTAKKKEQVASIKRQKKNKIHIDPARDIQIISRFPINSKVYRHYVAGGHIPDKFANCQQKPQIIETRKRSAEKILKTNERAIDVVATEEEQKSIEQFISQIYDCIDEYGKQQVSSNEPNVPTKTRCENCLKSKINDKIQKFEEQKITIRPLDLAKKPQTPLAKPQQPISRKCSMNCDRMEPIIEENQQLKVIKRKSTFDKTQNQQMRLNEKLQSEIERAYEERKKRFNQVKIALRTSSISQKERPIKHQIPKINDHNPRQSNISPVRHISPPTPSLQPPKSILSLSSSSPSPPLLPPQTYPSHNTTLSSCNSFFLPLPPPPPPANFDDNPSCEQDNDLASSSFIDDMIIKSKNDEIDNFILKPRAFNNSQEAPNNHFKPIKEPHLSTQTHQQPQQQLKSKRKGLNEIFPEIHRAIQQAGKCDYDYSWTENMRRDSSSLEMSTQLSVMRITQEDWCPASDLGSDFELDDNKSLKTPTTIEHAKKTNTLKKAPSKTQEPNLRKKSSVAANRPNKQQLLRKKSTIKSEHDYQSIIYDSHTNVNNRNLFNINLNRSSFDLSIDNDSLNELVVVPLARLPPPPPPAPWNQNLNKWIYRHQTRASSPKDPIVHSIKLRTSKRRAKRNAIVYKNSSKSHKRTSSKNVTTNDILDSIIYETDKSSVCTNSIEKKNPIYFSDNESIYNDLYQ